MTKSRDATIDSLVERAQRKHCGAKRRQSDGTCTRPAGWGTSHVGQGPCKLHGGSTRSHDTHARKVEVTQRMLKLGLPITIDAHRALLLAVHEAAGNVAFLREQAAALGVDVTHMLTSTRPDGTSIELGEEARGIVKLYGEWFDRLAKTAKMAVDAGVAKAHVEIAQQQADTMATVVRGVLDGLDLTPEQRQRGREIAAEKLRALTVSEPEGAALS